MKTLRVLLIEDHEDDAFLVLRALKRGGYEVTSTRVEDADTLRSALVEPWDIILSDWTLPTFGALEALAILRELRVATPFVVVSGAPPEGAYGIQECVMKDDDAHLVRAVERVCAR